MSNTPQIRFAGFTDAWEQRKLNEYLTVSTKKNTEDKYDKTDVLSVSGEVGVVNQIEFQGRSFAGASVSNYGVVETGDVVYTKSPLRANPYGIIKANKGKSGIVSTLYAVYKTIQGTANADFIECYFDLDDRLNMYLKPLVNIGAKHDMKVTDENALKGGVLFPSYEEQCQIADFFSRLDTLITLHQRKCDALQKFKKSMLQKMFPQNGESVPEIRFAGFTDAWEQRKFSELTEIRSASRVHKDEWQSSGVPFYRSSDVMAALNGTENEKAFISEELYEKLSAVSGKLEKGDVLVTGGGSVGKPYIVPNNEPLYTKDADLLWIKNNENLDPYFVYTFFFSPTFTDYLNSVSHVGTIAHYTITQLGETPITLPCVSEQQKIGDYFRNLDFLITLHQRKLETLQKMKKSLLQKMFV